MVSARREKVGQPTSGLATNLAASILARAAELGRTLVERVLRHGLGGLLQRFMGNSNGAKAGLYKALTSMSIRPAIKSEALDLWAWACARVNTSASGYSGEGRCAQRLRRDR